MNIRIKEYLSDNFIDTFKAIVDCSYAYNVEIGGRGGGKSVAIGESLLLATMADKYNTAIIMKYKEDLRYKVYANMIDAIRYLGLEKYWKCKFKPMEMVLLDIYGNETDTSIYFFGCDDENETKGIKATRGTGFRRAWLEEANRFTNMSVIENIINSIDRDNGNKFTCIMSYNPPMNEDDWINSWVYDYFGGRVGTRLGYETDELIVDQEIEKDKQIKKIKSRVHYSCYLDLIDNGHADFISDTWYTRAERSKICNNKFWRWMYLGDITGSGVNILSNIKEWTYDPDISEKIGSVLVHCGVDASNGGNDSWDVIKVLYEPDLGDIYILDEREVTGRIEDEELAINKYRAVADAILEINPDNEFMYGDGAVPTNIQMLAKDFDINIDNAKKRKGYKKISAVLWIAGLNNIYIDKEHTPISYKQLKNWSYKVDKRTDKIDYSQTKDKDDHMCDALIYALIDYITVYSNGGYTDADSI